MSAFDILPYDEFWAMSASRVQKWLRFKHILITGCPHPNMKFDEAGLCTLYSLDRLVSIQGGLYCLSLSPMRSDQNWSDLIRIFKLSLPAIASQTAWKISDQICSELPDLVSSVRSKSNQIPSRIWTDTIQHLITVRDKTVPMIFVYEKIVK